MFSQTRSQYAPAGSWRYRFSATESTKQICKIVLGTNFDEASENRASGKTFTLVTWSSGVSYKVLPECWLQPTNYRHPSRNSWTLYFISMRIKRSEPTNLAFDQSQRLKHRIIRTELFQRFNTGSMFYPNRWKESVRIESFRICKMLLIVHSSS